MVLLFSESTSLYEISIALQPPLYEIISLLFTKSAASSLRNQQPPLYEISNLLFTNSTIHHSLYGIYW